MCTNCLDWFHQWLSAQSGALAPDGAVVDMAYADTATLTFNNVVVPSTGLYNIDFRYAFGPRSGVVSIDCGAGAASPFVADTDFGGGTTSSTTHAINTSNWLKSPLPPQSVLQTNRHGQMTYRMGGFTPGSSRSVTLYFVEHYWTAAGKRVFSDHQCQRSPDRL